MSENVSVPKESSNFQKDVAFLNNNFKKNVPAYEVINTIRRFPRPIVVDFNNVLANNESPLQPNPDAGKFLSFLRKLGNIFIITSASSWDGVHEFLEKNKLWKPDMVIMNSPTWDFISQDEEWSPEASVLRNEYLERVKSLGWNINKQELVDAPASKRVAPIFNQPWQVPIIDDMNMATTDNPGMLGITVKAWEPNPAEWLQRSNKTKKSLEEAVNIVHKHFSEVFNKDH